LLGKEGSLWLDSVAGMFCRLTGCSTEFEYSGKLSYVGLEVMFWLVLWANLGEYKTA